MSKGEIRFCKIRSMSRTPPAPGPCPPAVFVLKSEIRAALAPPVDSFVPVLLYVQFWAVRTRGFTHTLMRNYDWAGFQMHPESPLNLFRAVDAPMAICLLSRVNCLVSR